MYMPFVTINNIGTLGAILDYNSLFILTLLSISCICFLSFMIPSDPTANPPHIPTCWLGRIDYLVH